MIALLYLLDRSTITFTGVVVQPFGYNVDGTKSQKLWPVAGRVLVLFIALACSGTHPKFPKTLSSQPYRIRAPCRIGGPFSPVGPLGEVGRSLLASEEAAPNR